jgi:hypothetical protein
MLLNRFIDGIELSGTSWKQGSSIDGMFYGYTDRGYDHSMENFVIKYTSRATPHGEENGWAIIFEEHNEDEDSEDEDDEDEDIICWWASYSSNQPLPPLNGWVPCDHRAHGNPTIRYVLRKEE